MNKTEVIEYIASAANLSKTDATRALEAFTDCVSKSLVKGDPVMLVGFGTFKITERKARSGRNPHTGATIQIAASKVPRFSAGKVLKDAVNEK